MLPSKKRSVAVAFGLALVASCGEALYFSVRTAAASTAAAANFTYPMSLFDVAVFIPFHASLPAFIAGLLLARLLQLDPGQSRPVSPIASGAAGLLTAVAVAVLPVSLSAFAPHFALLPLSFLVASLSSIMDVPSDSIPPALAFPHFSLEPLVLCALSAYAVQNAVWRLLSHIACPRFCTPVSTPWLAVAVPSEGSAIGYRPGDALSMRPALGLFVPILLVLSLVSAFFFLRPAMRLVSKLRRFRVESDQFAPLPSWATGISSLGGHAGGGLVEEWAVRKELDAGERILRATCFFAGMLTFMVAVWRLSWPVASALSHHTRKGSSLLCHALPKFLYNCDPRIGDPLLSKAAPGTFSISKAQAAGLLSKFPRLAAFGVDVLRWTSVLCLPAMVFNVLGHVIYPMPLWRGLPSVRQMLAARRQVSTSYPAPDEYSPALPDLDMDFVLFIRYVTRGTNPRLVARNARDAALNLLAAGVPPANFVVEVVTDAPLGLDAKLVGDATLSEIVVPAGYHPPKGARYKARALNYAIGVSPARDLDWIVHLDEETTFDGQAVAAIMLHCGRQTHAVRVAKSAEWPRIGQGPIMYGRCMVPSRLTGIAAVDEDMEDSYEGRDGDWDHYLDSDVEGERVPVGNWITTLADSSRVSDDLGRYRTQFELGEVWVGMHGSFVVTANCIEKLVTWDHGVEGSIAEDAYFAMLARSNSVQFSWIDAFMYEQSPFTFQDFVKQRGRWLVGGFKVCGASKIPRHVRIAMACLTCLWALMPFTYISLMLSIFIGHVESSSTDGSLWYFHIMLPLMAVISLWGYLYGFLVTFSVRDLGLFQFATLLYMQLALTPVYGLMEVSAVSYALWNFNKLAVGFHVVQKEDSGSLSASLSECTVEENTPLLNAKGGLICS